MNLYVAPQGKDHWSGKLPQPNQRSTDGPLATLTKARNIIRNLKSTGRLNAPATVWLRGGRYALTTPITFGPEDSAPVTYRAYKNEKPVFDGGVRITGWKKARVNNHEVWITDLPEVAAGRWYFRQLFVNGQRRSRTRWPKQGVFGMESVPGITLRAQLFEGTDAFIVKTGDIQNWKNLPDIDVIVRHYWVQERMPIVSYNPATGLIRSSRRSVFALIDGHKNSYAPYFLENVFEALDEPGQWYLDRPVGRLYYVPMSGETIDEIEAIAPRIRQFLTMTGKADAGQYVEFLRFHGLTFQYADWEQPPGGGERFGEKIDATVDYASAPQAAVNVPAVIHLEGVRHCAIEDCTIRHIGFYGMEISRGCFGNRIIGNHIHDLGAGGVKIDGSASQEPIWGRTGNNRITDNHIYAGGRVFEAGIGVLVTHGFGNIIAHNHIHDLYYTGISIGWVWGYGDNIAKDNLVEKNHIHDIGQGRLSDLGGIYTLGVQPGTVIRSNLIHHITKYDYGGWGIYLDEGSSHLVIENNICYDTDCSSLHLHFGRENNVRNNIWAFGNERLIVLSRAEDHVTFTFQNNIVVTDGQPIFRNGYAYDSVVHAYLSDQNLFWDVSGKPPVEVKDRPDKGGKTYTIEEMQGLGYDRYSLVADPKFKSMKRRDFTLAKDSPVLALGFTPIDLTDVGPRPVGRRK